MGAGLLVFVRNDLQSVIRVNQGQKAFYAADAGAQAAKRSLLADASPASYDEDGADTAACDSPDDDGDPRSSDWASPGGVARSFAGGEFTATVRWLNTGCGAPANGPPGAEFFEVVSTGTYHDARRKVRAVYATSEVGAPLANRAAGNVRIGAAARVSNGSVFSGGNVTAASGASISGTDRAYGTWTRGGYNAASRGSSRAGVAAVGTASGTAPVVPRYDAGSNPSFVASGAGVGRLTYPFRPGYWSEDPSRLDFMREEAMAQGNYRDSGGTIAWPDDSTDGTVVYVESGGVVWSAATCSDPSRCRGVLVVEGGSVVMRSGSGFGGGILTVGDSGDRSVTIENGATLGGFVDSGGDLVISGKVAAPDLKDALAHPGLHGVKLWSWSELYE